MQGETPSPLISKKSSFSWYVSLLFFLIVIGSSIALFFYDQYLTHQISVVTEASQKKDREINEISRDRDIIITKIVMSNTLRPSLDLVSLIARFREAASTA